MVCTRRIGPAARKVHVLPSEKKQKNQKLKTENVKDGAGEMVPQVKHLQHIVRTGSLESTYVLGDVAAHLSLYHLGD